MNRASKTIRTLTDQGTCREVQFRAVQPNQVKISHGEFEVFLPLHELALLMPDLKQDLASMRDTS